MLGIPLGTSYSTAGVGSDLHVGAYAVQGRSRGAASCQPGEVTEGVSSKSLALLPNRCFREAREATSNGIFLI